MGKTAFTGLNKKPKSEKGWQEWQRRYSLAFLSDQMDRIQLSVPKKNHVSSFLSEWEKKFRAECEKERPEETVGNTHDLVEDQIDFITQYIACAILDGSSKENLDRIKHFLSMQGAHNTEERMELRFLGGSPIETYAYVDTLRDIDIADVFFITSFDTMIVYREKMKLWTQKAGEHLIEAVKKDVLFDMPSAHITADLDNACGNTGLEISVAADNAELDLKMLQCVPPAFIERFKNS